MAFLTQHLQLALGCCRIIVQIPNHYLGFHINDRVIAPVPCLLIDGYFCFLVVPRWAWVSWTRSEGHAGFAYKWGAEALGSCSAKSAPPGTGKFWEHMGMGGAAFISMSSTVGLRGWIWLFGPAGGEGGVPFLVLWGSRFFLFQTVVITRGIKEEETLL